MALVFAATLRILARLQALSEMWLASSNLSADNLMTLQETINRLRSVQRQPQPKFCQYILPKEIQAFWQTIAPQEINEHQPVGAEFHQFSRLPSEIREMIWRFALPAQRPFDINIRINNQPRYNCVWAVGPFAMLEICQQSRRIALSVYEPRLELYPSREKPGHVFCGRPNTISRLEGHVFIYMRKEHPSVDIQPDSEVHSVVAWEDIPLGFMGMQGVLPEFVGIRYFENWPPRENEDPISAIILRARYEQGKVRFLPLRLQKLRQTRQRQRTPRRQILSGLDPRLIS